MPAFVNLPCSRVRCEVQNFLSCISRRDILVRIPFHHERVPATLHLLYHDFQILWGLTDLSQAVNAASAARYFAELHATPTA